MPLFLGLAVPAVLVSGFQGPRAPPFTWLVLLLIAPLFLFAIVVIHELSHLVTARALGLRANLIIIGEGPKLAELRLAGVALEVRAVPLGGLTLLGARSERWLRLRLWLTVLMGPASNFAMMVAPAMFWDAIGPGIYSPVAELFMAMNFLLLVGNLIPLRPAHGLPTDGWHLLVGPFRSADTLKIYLESGLVQEGRLLFEDGRFALARESCLRHLERQPDSVDLKWLLAVCEISLENYRRAVEIIEPLLVQTEPITPFATAALNSHLAAALLLAGRGRVDVDQARRIDELSLLGFEAFPCITGIRFIRSLVLTSLDRCEEALALLDYLHFDIAAAKTQATREIARAFAYSRRNKVGEAIRAFGTARQLDPLASRLAIRLGVAHLTDASDPVRPA